jgi:hypothetical protein
LTGEPFIFVKMLRSNRNISSLATILALALFPGSLETRPADKPSDRGVILGQFVAPPSPILPNPAFATSGLRYESPLDLDAELLTTKHHLHQLVLNYDGTAEGDSYDPREGAWIYVTTSRHVDRNQKVKTFDTAFNEVLAEEDANTLRRRAYFHFIDCATNFALCHEGIPFAASRFQRKKKILTLPSLIYLDEGGPCASSYRGFSSWRCTAIYHYFDLPLRRMPWTRNIKVARNDRSGEYLVVPAFPSPREQMRSLFIGREALQTSKIVEKSQESEGIWRISVMPYELDKQTTWFKELRLPS